MLPIHRRLAFEKIIYKMNEELGVWCLYRGDGKYIILLENWNGREKL
jgi:hypothetical protein